MKFCSRIFRMKLLIFCFSIIPHYIIAQGLYINLTPGLVNYAGDLQSKSFTFQSSRLSSGLSAMYNEGHFNFRLGLFFGQITADDKVNSDFPERNLNFSSYLLEGSVLIQYDFLDLNKDNKITPYIMGGIGMYSFNPYTFDGDTKVFLQPLGTEGQGLTGQTGVDLYKLTQFNIPAGIGIRYKLSESFSLGLEFCTRLIYTDYLDDVSGRYPNLDILEAERGNLARRMSYRTPEIDPTAVLSNRAMRGNAGNRDNYYNSSLLISYALFSGNRSDRFETGAGKKSGKSGFLLCPKKVN